MAKGVLVRVAQAINRILERIAFARLRRGDVARKREVDLLEVVDNVELRAVLDRDGLGIVEGERQEVRVELSDQVLPGDTIVVPERFF